MTTGLSALIVDDNDFDQECLTAALKSNAVFTHVMSRLSGDNLNAYLYSLGELPDVILLDINMPKIDGFEVLENLKSDSTLAKIPVIMFSSSTWDIDVQKAKSLVAIAFMHKGTSYFSFNQAGKEIENILQNKSKNSLSTYSLSSLVKV